ncbi:uncharacterized protein LOC121838096 [Ixodes scapularis]|uniref:uncharacterized protein LOC121838096 n=1 Tax=Ixodes scapularis TaxID=6945 RepID=UPI001C389A60|nr:uncharacterized protein LOC121838096 [Ixodes scapularis]
MSNAAAASAAPTGQVSAEPSDDGYRMQLPQLPHERRLEATVFLHGDLRGRPYRTQDFTEALEETVGMKHVVGLGTFQYNRVLICTLDNAEAKKRLAAFRELTVKERRCVISLPGRPPLCLRCNQLGHMGRQCQAPWCRRCRGYPHFEIERVRTYAAKVRVRVNAAPEDVLLEDGDGPMQLVFTEPLPPLHADDTSRDSGEHPEATKGECDVEEDNGKVAQIDDVVQLRDGPTASAEATGSTPAPKSAAPSAEAAAPCNFPNRAAQFYYA